MGLTALHRLLLRIAGWAPDDLVTAARGRLALSRTAEVAEMVAYGAAAARVPMLGADIDLLVAADRAGREDPLTRSGPAIPRVARLGLPWVRFTADHPSPAGRDPGADAAVDAAGIAAIERDSDGTVQGVWRAWRAPARPTTWPRPRRVFLVHATAEDVLPVLAARRQEMLEHAGEATPQVEVFSDPDDLPPYQRAALAGSTLLWSRVGTSALPVAPVFDPVATTGGPGFTGRRESLTPGERESILSYLDSGTVVLASAATMDDLVDRTSGATVPLGFRSDGRWVWAEATTYYLRHHGIAPDLALLEHIRGAGAPGAVDAVGVHRALAGLRGAPTAADPTPTSPGPTGAAAMGAVVNGAAPNAAAPNAAAPNAAPPNGAAANGAAVNSAPSTGAAANGAAPAGGAPQGGPPGRSDRGARPGGLRAAPRPGAVDLHHRPSTVERS